MTKVLVLGDITIHQVIEQEAPFFDVPEFFPALTEEMLAENRSWLEPRFIDPSSGKLILRIQSYILQTPHHNILIDPCIGNHKPRPRRLFWHMLDSDRYEKNLARTGLTPDDIHYVMCTHLHPDHVGWNTRLDNGRWVPTFPNARYLMADSEMAHWTERQKRDPDLVPWITDSVLPVVEAGRVVLVQSDHVLDDLVRLLPTPGHTIDHYSVLLGSEGEQALVTGDMMHSPLQALYPELGMFADFDSNQAGKTRRTLFDRYCDTSLVFCTAHFPTTSLGRIVRQRDAFKFVDL
jgi:glyoxylase-like metal-dependent hydrolase (beta-lactamase superfamily II)